MPRSEAHIASRCELPSFDTKITLPYHSLFLRCSRTNFSPSLPECKLITVTKLSKGLALALKEVGAEYFSKNSLTPLLAFSVENSASFYSFPGAKKITV